MSFQIDDLDIAIIGMAGRFPGARDIQQFWTNLQDGVEAVRPLPRGEGKRVSGSSQLADDPSYVRAASTLDDVGLFDAAFFGISPREASLLDPQGRVFLECAWEALESAGYNPQDTGRSVGVFAAQSLSTYLLQNVHPELTFREFVLAGGNLAAILGNGNDFLTTRVSYKLNLSGPSVNVQSACSSSLVAVHLARQALLSGECDMALAGGVSIYLPQEVGYRFQEGMILSPDGHCRPFDADAQGTVFGRGVGIAVMKPLAAAVRDGDQILAILKGSAVNNDGATKVGYTAPGFDGQAGVIAQALANAGVDAETISYIETHGTGTAQGDPIEITALTRAFRETSTATQFCAIGSVKGNIGHLDVAAGITGLIKTVLMLQHRVRPSSLNFTRPNPQIDFANSPFYVNTETGRWPSVGGTPRRAGVSSFGMGGTNAHVILEEAPAFERETGLTERPVHILPLSAKTPEALRALAARHLSYLGETTAAAGDICYTAGSGRAHWKHRLAVVGNSVDALRDRLGEFLRDPGLDKPADSTGGAPRIAFLFTGQGAQYPGMARQLYETHPKFRAAIDRCGAILGTGLPRPLIDVLYPSDPDDRAIDATTFTQPALFAVEYALAELWRSWGITPSAVAGHSIGEYVAACVAGVLSLEDALRLVARRGQLMDAAPGKGAMVAVFAPEDEVLRILRDVSHRVSLAAINGPSQVVVSGEQQAVKTVVQRFENAGMRWQYLPVSHAFHSPCMDPVLDEFELALRGAHFEKPRLDVISNLSGKLTRDGEFTTPGYWRRQLREPVRFSDCVKSLLGLGYRWFLEIGPHPTLTSAAKMVAADQPAQWLASLRRGMNDWEPMLESLASLYRVGAAVDWGAFDAPYARRREALPTYPFQRQRYWLEPAKAITSKPEAQGLPGERLKSPALNCAVFQTVVGADAAYLNDHRLFGMAVFPATAYVAAAFGAASAESVDAPIAVEGLVLKQALIVPDGEQRVVQSVLTPQAGGASQFQFFSESAEDGNDGWVLHASATIRNASADAPTAIDLGELRRRMRDEVSVTAHYDRLYEDGLQFGPAFRGLVKLYRSGAEVLGHVVLPEHLTGELPRYAVHPALLDAVKQTLLQAVETGDHEPGILVPVSIDRLSMLRGMPTSVWSHARVSSCGAGCYVANIHVYDESGSRVAEIEGLRVQRVVAEALKGGLQRDPAADWLYEVSWEKSGGLYTTSMPAAPLLTAPNTLAADIAPALEPLGATEGLPRYREMLAKVDRLCAIYAERALVDLGWKPVPGARVSAESLGRELAVLPRHTRLLRRLLDILQEEGCLHAQGDGWVVSKPLTAADHESLSRNLMDEYPESCVQLSLVVACGAQLAPVLRGHVDPLHLLFPEGSVANLERLYGESVFARVYNRLAGEAIAAACAKVPAGQKIRVLEVGAGTGGTTRYVLPNVQKMGVEYTFSDLGNLFLHKARERFQQYPNLRFEILDAERDPLEQGFVPHQFDIVLASNVLHATSDLRRTLGYMKDLLAPEGLLVFIEGTGPARWVDLTFGLTEGWWKFTDEDLRPAHALLSRARWLEVLTEAGFSEAAAFPGVDGGDGDGWQIIGLARTPAIDAEALAQEIEGRKEPWLIVRDRGGFAALLRQQLALRGEAALIIASEDLKRGSAFKASAQRIRGVVHVASLDAMISPESDATSLEAASELAAGSVLSLVQQIADAYSSDPPQLWIVTRGAQEVAGVLETASLPQSIVWGLGRTLAFEHPELRCVRIDLDACDVATASKLCQEILAADAEDQIAIRGLERHIPRLVRKNLTLDDPVRATPEMSRLTIGERGVIDNLRLTSAGRRAPGPSEVEIRVSATGLNFRDVLNALGMYPGSPPPFGGECAGTVVRVGSDVQRFREGDEVVALAYDSFATFATTRQEFVALKPPSLASEVAAAVPAAFLTASYGLLTKARLTKGDRVLIHAAAGGVGYAAVQLAQRAGAEIFATAGSDEKRNWLRSLGVAHVFDSRSTAFAAAILELTHGAGVDVVLNSLSGEFIPKSLSVTAAGGRFIELGKANIWEPEQARNLRPDLEYHVIDFAEESDQDPAWVANQLPAIIADIADGHLDAPPVTMFPLEDAASAFRFMAQAKHMGKLVLTQKPHAAGSFRPDATYLITGGYGALGLAVTRWMTERGARHFVLMGRSGASDSQLAQIREIEQLGAAIRVAQGDVSRQEHVRAVVEPLLGGAAPLRGVIHSAGMLDDGVLLQQSWQRFERVLGAKMNGAWNLHTATAGASLDFFVLFSSVASLLGSAGQGNHAAANSFLDALAWMRRRNGLPALSINWGPWSEIGAAATARAIVDRIRQQGMQGIPPEGGLRVFDALMRSDSVQVGVLPVNWGRFVAPFRDRVSPYFSVVARDLRAVRAHSDTAGNSSADDIVSRLRTASAVERRVLLVAHIRNQVRQALGFEPGYVIDDGQPLSNIGLDSLMAVELRNMLGASLSVQRSLPATLIFDYPTVNALADHLLEHLGLGPKEVDVPVSGDHRAALTAEIEQLSDEEAELLLLQELAATSPNQKGNQ